MEEVPTSYEPIFLATPDAYNTTPGILKFAKQGVGWKNSKTGQVITIAANDIKRVQWMRVARQYRLKFILKNGAWQKLDNFPREDFDSVKHVIRSLYRITLETRELSLKGGNWGKTEFQGNYLTFNAGTKTIFEVPLGDVANTNLAGKSEVSLEFLPPDRLNQADAGRAKGTRVDELVEMRFYIPGTTTSTKAARMETSGTEETQNAANVFYDMVKNKADLGQVTGESIALFQEILCLTPRGRYDIDMFPSFLRLRGKTYDYKISYESVIKLFLLSKPDDLHMVFVLGLDPPIRQGQTRYPFLVFQFIKDEEMDIELNLDEATLKEKYAGKLQKSYSDPTYQVVSSVFRGLTGRNVAVTGGFNSLHQTAALKCSLKANEGYIYPLQKCFLFIPKPPTFIPHSEIGSVHFSRVGAATAAGPSRTFDMKFNMLSGTDYQFSSIPKEEYNVLEQYLREKKIKMKNELPDGNSGYADLSNLDALSDLDDSDAGDDDDESPDEDFQVASEESDVPEEYDEEYESAGESEDGKE
ncbi:FACT complex subunit pob3 [Dimargaris cristalligena]|uniref:FACT complex subunit POB3 n=1 Tax=Dimargaris cristalligena TaxID=215637 RepID=A0A4P9ZUF3_9FUNG|nr:FACT complex subunit pob3 [Dimargaris cristalligena]|eukprot:RKP37175.1 FACT complex subunit pob3 [Dimargaris cristalligena]